MFIKGLVYLLTIVLWLMITRRFDSTLQVFIIDLLSRIICTTVIVSDWCITNLAHGWEGSIQSIACIVRGGNWSLSGSSDRSSSER